MGRKTESSILNAHKTTKGLHQAGMMDQITMHETENIDEDTLTVMTHFENLFSSILEMPGGAQANVLEHADSPSLEWNTSALRH